MFRPHSLLALALSALVTLPLFPQQAPIALPNTVTTVGGGGTALTAGSACSAGSPLTATDALGDGCPATLAQFSTDLRGGVGTDPVGNIYIMDTSNSAVRVINARSGIVTLFAGRGTACASKTDSNGDGCPLSNTAFSSTPRGMGSDPYGNIFIAGYNSHLINVLCTAVSPLCPNTAGTHQVGSMYLVAGCVATTTSAGTGGNGTDGGTATPTGSCSTSVAELNGARGVAADRYGNVYIADTGNLRYRVVVGPASFNGIVNPIASLIALNPAYSSVIAATAAGNIYPLLGGFTSPANGAPCTTGASVNSLDANGDGCPYYVSSLTSPGTSAVQGVAVDANGNILFTDLADRRLRVIYMGGAQMANAITLNNPGVTPVVGSIYSIAGGGASGSTATPALGKNVSIDTAGFKITLDPAGNIYIGDNTFVLFFDINTGYIRRLFATGAACSAATDSIGDGCPVSQSTFGAANGLGLAFDNFGNLFFTDDTNHLIREVAATNLLPTKVNSTSTQNIILHGGAGTTAIATSLANTASSNPISLGSVTCGTVAADGTLDCTIPVTFAPTTPGSHVSTLAATATVTSTAVPATFPLTGIASGPAITFDGADSANTTIGSALSAATLTTDGNGNLFTYDRNTSSLTLIGPSGTATPLPGTLLSAPTQIALDSSGNLYAVGDGSSTITKVTLSSTGTYSAGTVFFAPNGSAAAPQAMAVDAGGNLYVYDSTSKAIYRQSTSSAGTQIKTLASGFTNVVAIAIDPSGKLFVSDTGTNSIYTITTSGSQATLATGVSATALAVDAAGDLFAQDAVSKSVLQFPISGFSTGVSYAVFSPLTTPAGLAVDSAGNLYVADAAQTSIIFVPRSTTSISFGTNTVTTHSGTITNAGNAASTGILQTDSADFQLAAGATNGCNVAATSFAAGSACTVTASFTPQAGTGNVTDAITFSPATSVGSFSLSGTKTGGAVTTTTTISGQIPASPIFTASGAEVTFTVAVAASSGTASGSIAVSVDSGAPVNYTLDSTGQATIALSGISAGSHSISATYASQNGFTGSSTTSATSFSITQAAVSVAWTPGATSQPVSHVIGLGNLNATAVIQGTSTPAPGNFVYTATPSGGFAISVDASTNLPIGTYSLNVLFVPTDSVDYSSGTASVATYTVTQASTTAAIGGTQNLVAADGSGNFTSLQAALNSLPTTGGSVYIKPGTYTGFVTINLPNVSLRGLGGDPTKVIVTNENGAFSPPYLAGQGPGNNGSTGDQGSATLVVAKGTVNGGTATPNNFYMEGVSVVNTYDTDSTNSNPVGTIGGVCQTITPTNNQALYNGSNNAGSPGLCNSQALAMWITADQAVLNNIYLTSLQDTLYAGSQGCGATCTVARQYYWRGKITGDVDYIFGDAAAVFDHTNIYSLYHGASATGTVTIEAQNKKFPTGGTGDYLSGYIYNSATLTSQSTGMTQLLFGRPYGTYSTNILLNTYVDQVNPTGWIEFSGDTNLPTSTYAEFNTIPYTDPATGSPDVNGVVYTGTGGNTGTGVTGTREITSLQPGHLTAAQAAPYFPLNFLGGTVSPASLSTGSAANWDAAGALTVGANAFVPSGASATINGGSSITILMRPQTPGAGTIPTGTWTLSDGSSSVASGNLDASGQASYTTSTLTSGTHSFTWSYGGDANFAASTTATPFVVTVNGPVTQTTLISAQPTGATYGSPASVAVTVSPTSGSIAPTGQISLAVDGGSPITAALSSTGTYTFPLTSLSAGSHSLAVAYAGNSSFSASTLTSSITIGKAVLQVTANNISVVAGQSVPAYTATFTGFVNGDTQVTAFSGTPSLTTNPASPTGVGSYPITVAAGTLSASNYTFSFANGTLVILPSVQATAVATGDTRTVREPTIPALCTTLTASLLSVNDDIPTSIDATNSNPDGARIQAALTSCANTNQAVRLAMDSTGNNAFLSGPLSIPSGVTLLIDPGVTLYASRNVQDYDIVPGTHTCGTVNSNSATSSCLPVISISNVSNVGIMGFGKINGRGGDTLLNAFPASYAGQSWWGLSAIANSGGNQQNPRFIQIRNSSNITLYKITLKNSPLFHISTTGGQGMNGFTAWDIKIVTPTSSRNTDGIDPGNAQNVTVTRSWVSDGDDNVAVGASGTVASQNISILNNHFFAGHGESIGSITEAGVSNILFDGNMLAGNSSADSNSTGIRIKSANDRGGVVQNIQYSNSCFQNHKAEIQFTPLYNTNTGTETPNFKNILLQNLAFLTEDTVQFTGANNNGVINPLTATFDNVSFAILAKSDFNAAPTNAQLTLGPGQVSSNFVTNYQTFVSANGNTLTDNRTASALAPPVCSFTFIAPELTGPAGIPQTVTAGQIPTAVVILTPAVGGSPYPTGSVTLTDETNHTLSATLPGTGDTVFIPIPNVTAGTHTYTATYSGDANYVPPTGSTVYTTTSPYTITVNGGSLGSSTTTLTGVPSTSSYGISFTLSATVTGATPTGNVQFVMNGTAYSSVPLNTGGQAQYTANLPVGSYSITAVYDGDIANAGSSSSASAVTVAPTTTTTTLASSTTSTTLGVPVKFTATVSSLAGTPSGTVNFTYTTTSNPTPVTIVSAALINGAAAASANLPVGTNNVSATFVASGNFASSTSTPPLVITVNPPVAVPLPATPLALPYTISTLAGGATASGANTSCTGSVDSFGNGCQATSISFTSSSLDLRGVVADPFGNIYLTDANASQIRRIAPNGIISNFAGYVSGTACVPTATIGCTPTLVKLNKPRGVSADPQGNIYIAGYSDNKVYKVHVSDGLLYVLAGSGTRPSDPTATNGDGGSAAAALINQPRSAWADSVGNTYIADTADNRIRVVDVSGNIQNVVGTGTANSTGDSGPATAATINNPQGVLTDASDNLYIAESARIRVVCITCTSGSGLYQLLQRLGVATPQNGYIYTLAGGGAGAYTAPALANTITMAPQKLAIDNNGDIYVSDGNGFIWFIDSRTGYIRPIAGGATTNTTCNPNATPNIGDGCPATQAIIGNGGNGIGVGTDILGNVYISDTLNARIRKVSTNLQFPAGATGTPTTQNVLLHFIAGDSLSTTNAISSEFALGIPACSTNADTTQDCLVAATFTPAVAGSRSTPLSVNSAASNTSYFGLTGTGIGAGATLDPAAQLNFGSNLQIVGLAIDNTGNVYVSDNNSKKLLLFTPAATALGANATPTTLATLTAPGPVAVDSRGFVYVADTSTGLITQVSPAGTTSTLPFTLSTPSGLATDAIGNLYASDSTTKTVYQLNPATGAQRTLNLGPLTNPAGLSVDPSVNLIVVDAGAPAIYRYNFSTGAHTSITNTAAAPNAVASDAAGNLIVADTAAPAIFAIPASANSSSFTLVSGFTPSALALDAAGNVYTSSGNGSVLKLIRTEGAVAFAGVSSSPQTFSLLSTGNQNLSISSLAQTDHTDFSLSAASTSDCTVNAGVPSALPFGGVCTLTASFTPQAAGNDTDLVTFNGNQSNPALSTPPSLQLTLTGQNSSTTTPTTTALGAFTPANPTYGQTVSVTATVSASSGTPAGTITFTVDGNTMAPIALSNQIATTSLSALAVGTHTVSAAYTSNNGFTASASAAANITIVKATATVNVSATPASITAGGSVTLSATVSSASGNPTGSVQFLAGTTALGSPVALSASGTASLITTALPSGAQSITASYTGDGNFNTATSSAATVTIVKATPIVSVSATPASITAGGSVTLSATVSSASGSPTGSVQFLAGTTALGSPVALSASGAASLVTTALPSGAQSITASYTGDGNFNAATSSAATVTVRAATTLALTASPAIPPAGLPQGTSETFTATLTGGSGATGTLTFYDGTTALGTAVTLTGNTASFTTSSLSVGAHSITAQYSGDTLNTASTSNAIAFTTLSSVLPGFATTASPITINLTSGGSGTASIAITPNSLYGGTITFSCSSLPSNLTCSFSPTSLTFTTTNSASQTTTITVKDSGTHASLFPGAGSRRSSGTTLATIFGLPCLLLVAARRRYRSSLQRLLMILLLITASIGAITLSGCGGSHDVTINSFTVNATDGTNTRTIPVTVTIQ